MWRKWDVRGAGLDWWRAIFVLQCTEPQEHWAWAGIFQKRWGYKRTQSGSYAIRTQSGSNRRNRGAAAEADAIGELLKSGKSSWSERKWQAAAEGTQSVGSSWSGRKRGTAVWSGSMQSGSSSSAQGAVRRRITHVGERGEVAERAKRAKLLVIIIFLIIQSCTGIMWKDM